MPRRTPPPPPEHHGGQDDAASLQRNRQARQQLEAELHPADHPGRPDQSIATYLELLKDMDVEALRYYLGRAQQTSQRVLADACCRELARRRSRD